MLLIIENNVDKEDSIFVQIHGHLFQNGYLSNLQFNTKNGKVISDLGFDN